MEKIETSYYIISLVSAILSGLISSYIWSWITRKLCFPQLEIDERIQIVDNNRIIKIHNRDSRFGAYDVNCYLDCEFTYEGQSQRYCLASDNIAYLKAQTDADIRVKLPQKVTIKNNDGKQVCLVDAFYNSSDAMISVTIVCQNKYGVKHSPIQHQPVKKDIQTYYQENQ